MKLVRQACLVQVTFVMQELTWLQQFLSKLVSTNGSAGPSSRSLVVPLIATTQWRSITLKGTFTDRAMAGYLPMPLLSVDHTLEVRNIMYFAACKLHTHGLKHTVAATFPQSMYSKVMH